jgi:tripartite-type tricarboxylate transporter receptor subunit TctC
MKSIIKTALTLLSLSSLALIANAQDYPTKSIKIVVGQGAGGGIDTLARIVSQKMSVNLGQPVVIENKTGAGGIIATEYVAKAPPDGYTLLMGPIGNMVFTPILNKQLRYSTTKDFAPISTVATFPLIAVVTPGSNIKSINELVAFMKANPNKSNYGGSGPAFQFASELFRIKTNTSGEFIQYKSTSETITALISGDLLTSMVDTGPAIASINSGAIRALAVSSPNRIAALPNVPTMAELGLPDVEFRFWAALFAPAGTPSNVVKILENEINRVLKMPDVINLMANNQVTASGSTSEELNKLVISDLQRWGQVAEKSKINGAQP